MTPKEIVDLAASGAEMPPLKLPERVLWMTVEKIKSSEKSGYIGPAVTAERIERAIKRYELDRREYELNTEALHSYASFWKAVELAATAYRKEPTAENGQQLLDAIYERRVSGA